MEQKKTPHCDEFLRKQGTPEYAFEQVIYCTLRAIQEGLITEVKSDFEIGFATALQADGLIDISFYFPKNTILN